MQQLKFENTNSIAKTNQIIPISLSKTGDPCTFPSRMGELNASLRAFSQASTPHSNDLNEYIGEAERVYKQRSRALDFVAKRRIELSKFSNINLTGDFYA